MLFGAPPTSVTAVWDPVLVGKVGIFGRETATERVRTSTANQRLIWRYCLPFTPTLLAFISSLQSDHVRC